MDPDAFLQAQSIEYQRHPSQLAEIKTTVEHQLTIQSFKTIPKQYQPQNHLKASNPSLTEEFISEYNHLFFRHLEKVVTNNQIKVELHKATLTNIIIQTETHLSRSSLTLEQVTTLYTKFCQENGITDRAPIPEKKHHTFSMSYQARQTGSFFIPRPSTSMDTSLTVHNLSSVVLTPEELQLLSKGLSFSPTPTIPREDIHSNPKLFRFVCTIN